MRKTPLILVLAAAAAFGGFAATALREAITTPADAHTPPTATSLPLAAALPSAVAGQAVPSLAPMLQKVLPAVVSVHSKQRQRVNTPFGNDPVFRRMFGIPEERILESLGSGVIVDAQQGLILTNHHVIEGADDVSVTLADGRTLKATFRGSDADTDIALMQIPAQNLSALPIADSSRLRVGDFVVAVGNPFGVGQTVTSGIVSALGRSNLPGLGYQNFIQTDASINPGNSGGALVDLNGQLVGINTASFNPQGSMAGNIGLGFAIPSSLASTVMRQLLANKGMVRRGTLGVATSDSSNPAGARVTRVYDAGSGLQVGDVITAVNGQRVASMDDFHNIEGLQVGATSARLDVVRAGKAATITSALRQQSGDGASLDPRLAGVTFAELPESYRRQGLSGVLVASVSANSRAARSGLNSGDVLLEGTNGRFNDLTSFRASFRAPPQQLRFRVLRDDRVGELMIP
ncbi:trypsin-like peptidase domain-containing protein [Solilutibacter silvestris]|uniref:Trypsin-like peptidase n=1 Tax=Solilutibacter silvestris TaxID=1645665 RepID=A0A2K1Q2B2_9GAMM|nr:trypsin-like peptidase domain-containing protein [Lysobacter silvestris]PNS09121.1 Trypsin-like peptidase [Lysobacter silvestris]